MIMKYLIQMPYSGLVRIIIDSVSDEVFLIVYNTIHQVYTNPTTGSIVMEELHEEEYAGSNVL